MACVKKLLDDPINLTLAHCFHITKGRWVMLQVGHSVHLTYLLGAWSRLMFGLMLV
jgi:hypothetical protein